MLLPYTPRCIGCGKPLTGTRLACRSCGALFCSLQCMPEHQRECDEWMRKLGAWVVEQAGGRNDA